MPVGPADLFAFAVACTRYGKADEMIARFAAHVAPLGFHSYVILELPMFPNEVPVGHEQSLTRFDNLPPEWTELYVRNEWWRVDPVAIMFYSRNPFTWREAYDALGRSPSAQEVIDAAKQYGLVDGFVVPMLDTRSAQMVVSLGSRERVRLSGETRAALVFAATALGGALQALRGTAGDRQPLTERQREALRWTAAGKTAWEAGSIMNISEDTVNRHLASARQTLGASTTAHAVALAIRQGELRL